MTDPACSFCGKSSVEATILVKGPVAVICDECVDLCAKIVAKSRAATVAPPRPWRCPVCHSNMLETRAGLERCAGCHAWVTRGTLRGESHSARIDAIPAADLAGLAASDHA